MELPRDRFVTVDGHRLRYWEAGSGPPLLLLHGLGSSALVWHRVIPLLAREFRVLALDLPGHGLSDMPRRRFLLPGAAALSSAFMEALDAPSFHVAGNSMGGSIALELGLRHPASVRSVALVDSASLGWQVAWFLRLASLRGLGERFERPTMRRIQALIRSVAYDPACVSPEMTREMLRLRQRPGASRALLVTLRTGVSLLGQRRSLERLGPLQGLRAHLLVLWGRQDRIVPLVHAHAAVRRAPQAQLHVFERCGHWPQVEHPDEFAQVLSEFLRRVESTAPSAPLASAGAPTGARP